MEEQIKRTDKQYIDVLICFCNYVLISKKMSHQKEDIMNFLEKNSMEDLKSLSNTFGHTSIAYEVWQIFDFLNNDDLERIRAKTLLHCQHLLEKDNICTH